ncbi:MAG: TolC family protein [Candidatus Delongbacteria bacterium]
MDSVRCPVRPVLLFLVSLVLLGTMPASGQVSLDSLVQRALRQAPELPEMEAAVKAAQARVTPAAALPDPALELGGQAMGLPPGDNSTLTLELSQELPFPGKRGARRAVAEAEVTAREAARLQRMAEVVIAVRTHYADLYAIDRRGHVLAVASQLIEAAIRTMSARLSAGQVDQESVLRLEIQAARIRQQAAGLKAERTGAVAELNRLLGEAPDHPFGEITALPSVVPPPPDSLRAGIEASPELLMRQAEVLAARRRFEEARLEGRPDFMVGAGGGMTAMPEPVVMLRLGMSLPIWKRSKQDRLREAAGHDLQAAEAALEAERARLSTDLAGLVAEWGGTQETLREFQTTILPQSQSALDAALAAYAAGRGEFALVVEDLNLLLEAGAESAQAEADRLSIWARIEALGPRATSAQGRGDTP